MKLLPPQVIEKHSKINDLKDKADALQSILEDARSGKLNAKMEVTYKDRKFARFHKAFFVDDDVLVRVLEREINELRASRYNLLLEL